MVIRPVKMKIDNYKDLVMVFSCLMMILLAIEVVVLRTNVADLKKERSEIQEKLEDCRNHQFHTQFGSDAMHK